MATYNNTLFDPPAPFVHIRLRNRLTDQVWTDVPMLLDSGADVTLIPRKVIEIIGVIPIQDMHFAVSGYDSQVSELDVVTVELTFCRRRFYGQYLLTDESWGILGRNVLNRIALVFDGPNLQWDELQR